MTKAMIRELEKMTREIERKARIRGILEAEAAIRALPAIKGDAIAQRREARKAIVSRLHKNEKRRAR